jgi:hypothetical protein
MIDTPASASQTSRAPPRPPPGYAAFALDPDGNNMEAVCREG